MNLQLKQMRKRRGLTQTELAEEIGSTMRIVSSWETGETSISLTDAARVADVFECPLDELAGRDWSPGEYSDPRQAELNQCWCEVGEARKERLLGTARDLATAEGRTEAEASPDARRQAG